MSEKIFYFKKEINGIVVKCPCLFCSQPSTYEKYIRCFEKLGIHFPHGNLLSGSKTLQVLKVVDEEVRLEEKALDQLLKMSTQKQKPEQLNLPRLFNKWKDTPSYLLNHIGSTVERMEPYYPPILIILDPRITRAELIIQ